MTREERDIIAGIFERLRSVAGAPRDPEAERFIADLVRAQPYAPYAMAQTVYAQDQALHQMNARIEELQAELEKSSRQQSGGFLGGLFGGGRREPEPRRPMSAPDHGRGGFGAPTGAPQPGYGAPPTPWGAQPARGGGFLAGAMSTAAGVAGGMLLANALGDMFGGGEAKATETGGGHETHGDQWSSGHDSGDEPQIDDGAFFEDL